MALSWRLRFEYSEKYRSQQSAEAKANKWSVALERLTGGYPDNSAATFASHDTWVEYRAYKIHMRVSFYCSVRAYGEDRRKLYVESIRDELLEILASLGIQSDRVYLESERMWDTRIDCWRVAA